MCTYSRSNIAQLARDTPSFKEPVSCTIQRQKEGNMYLNITNTQITKPEFWVLVGLVQLDVQYRI